MEGDSSVLQTVLATLIHGVEYSSDWYKDELKSNGGWSLEMIDTRFPFYYSDNWIVSESKKGGTPGSVNSVSESNPDISFYGIQNVFPVDSTTILIRFTEPVFTFSGETKNIKIEGYGISDLFPTDPLFREFRINLSDPLQLAEVHQLEIADDISDFAGNRIQKWKFNFGLTEPAKQGDILFNEILFNSLPGDPDYLELFNSSGKIIDASRIQLVSVNDDAGEISEPVTVSEVKRCILPGTYYALTTSINRVSERYPSTDPDYLFEIAATSINAG